MISDPVDVFWTILGLIVWPGLTFCVILWKLGHPLLGLLALIVGTRTQVETIRKR